MRLWHDRRGNAALGWMAALLLILCVGAMYDVYAAYHYRTWGYQVAGEAARYAVLQGSGLNYASGDVALAPDAASTAAETFLRNRLAEQSITDFAFQTHVVVDPVVAASPAFPGGLCQPGRPADDRERTGRRGLPRVLVSHRLA